MKQQIWIFFLLAFGFFRSGFAQTPQALRIGPGDTLQVNVYDTPDLSQTVVVDDAGNVKLSLLGLVPLANLSTVEASLRIEERLTAGGFMRRPHVDIAITHAETQTVSVLGEVNHPGPVQITTPRPILEVLALADGLSSLANRNITIQHRGQGSSQTRYFVPNDLSLAGNSGKGPIVFPGDIVVVPKAGVIYVMGDVIRPGGIAMTSNTSTLSLLQALTLAGSMTHTARVNEVYLIRKKPGGYEDIIVPVSKIEHGKMPDFELRADDIVYVPFSYIRNVAISAGAIAASVTSATIYTLP